MNPEETKQALLKARGLIEKGWCKEAYARDTEGNPLSPCSMDATQYCVVGAVNRNLQLSNALVREIPTTFVESVTWMEPKNLSPYLPIAQKLLQLYNDHKDTPKEDILGLFDTTINQLDKVICTHHHQY